MPKKILVIGHSLAAEQNRLPFKSSAEFDYHLAVPKIWESSGLKRKYIANLKPGSNSHIYSLDCLFAGKNSFFIWKNLKTLIKRLRPHIIYCWEEPWCLSTFQILSTYKKCPVVFFSAENKPKKLPVLFKLIQNYVYKKASAAIVISQESKNRLVNSGFQKNVYIVPLWIYHTQYVKDIQSKSSGIYIGRLIKLKAVDLLIKSLPFLHSFHLTIVGDGPEKEKLESLAKELKVQDRIKFTGVLNEKAMENLKLTAGLALFPTMETDQQAEQFGKAALECMASGIPAICSNTGNYSHFKNEIPICHLFEQLDPQGISNKIKQLLEDYPLESTRKTASDYIIGKYGPNKASEEFEACWKNL